MKKIVSCLIFMLFPFLARAADGSLSFTPPTSDVSVVFLGNIFGVVDGVLHGTGSQIMGEMFGVFNAAVLALGGIVIIYTLLVSTMNTAHEGQMLGQKWSSMWVPLRACLGLALLVPKASGYCVIQILFMWVIVQGVGAADKVWSAALSYLNRGGIIVQAQINPAMTLLQSGGNVANAARVIVTGQTCMLGLQTVLKQQREAQLALAEKDSGECGGEPTDEMAGFCTTPVPDFLSSVNAVTYQSTRPTDAVFNLPMPNFQDEPYSKLNGICGTISWKPFASNGQFAGATSSLTPSELETATLSRAIGIQQMYMGLRSMAQIAVNNDPQIMPTKEDIDSSTLAAPYAENQFGVPYLLTGTPCTGGSDSSCQTWGPDPTSKTPSLFNGSEFQYAVTDYTAIMQPTLNLLMRASSDTATGSVRAAMEQANASGWMMAGSYFFDLVQINSSAINSASSYSYSSVSSTDPTTAMGQQAKSQAASLKTQLDNASGLEDSKFDPTQLTNPFSNSSCVSTATYSILCTWLVNKKGLVDNINRLINGSNYLEDPLSPPDFSQQLSAVAGQGASTIYGVVQNSGTLQLPGQPGLSAPTFKLKFQPNLPNPSRDLPPIDFPCVKSWGICWGKVIGEVIYNLIIVTLFKWVVGLAYTIISAVVMLLLFVPLQGMSVIFSQALYQLTIPNVNPIVGLANMGTFLINFATNLWIVLTLFVGAVGWIPFVGAAVEAVTIICMPLLMAWMTIILGIGFICSYYIPFMPYMIFTFGSIAWLMAVIEAMVAAPLVALGITHPEGEGPFGKGDHAIMIVMNVFLRPSMMILGYIAGIILSYVAVWIINAGFGRIDYFIQGVTTSDDGGTKFNPLDDTGNSFNFTHQSLSTTGDNSSTGYVGWAGIYGYFFSIIIYTSMYLTVVQKSFSLINVLPDKVLRWIGGQAESYGSDTAQWSEEEKGKVEKSGDATAKAGGQTAKAAGTEMVNAGMKAKQRLSSKGAKIDAKGTAEKSDGEGDS